MNVDRPFDVAIEPGLNGAARLVVAGEIDLETAPLLRQALADATSSGDGPLVVDLHGVTFLDSTGLNALLGARATLVDAGRRLTIERASSRVLRVFEVTGVSELLVADGSSEEPRR